MAIFDYRAKDRQGRTLKGAVEAPSEGVATGVLREQNLIILGISERKRTTLFQTSLGIFNRVSRKSVVVFARQLAVMISATVPIVQALRILVKQTDNITFKIIISEIADEVDGGAKLSAALARYPSVFSDFFVHMVRSGETTGKLDETLNYLADQQEKDYDLLSKVKGAMIYPAFILVGMIAVGVLMMTFVIPRLTETLKESGAELPPITRALIGVSNFLTTRWWLLALLIIAGAVGLRLFTRTSRGKEVLDHLKLRTPIFGKIYQHIYLVRLSRSLGTLLVSGVPLTRSLEIVADVVGNSTYARVIHQTIKDIEGGGSISSAMLKSKEIPPMLPSMMTVGEQTGKLDLILEKISNFFAKELENTIANLVTLIEPLIIIVMGIGVVILILGILLPMYNLSSAIAG